MSFELKWKKQMLLQLDESDGTKSGRLFGKFPSRRGTKFFFFRTVKSSLLFLV